MIRIFIGETEKTDLALQTLEFCRTCSNLKSRDPKVRNYCCQKSTLVQSSTAPQNSSKASRTCQLITSRDPSSPYKWDQTRPYDMPSWKNCRTDCYLARSCTFLSPRNRTLASPCHVCCVSPTILEWTTRTQRSRCRLTWRVPFTLDSCTDGTRQQNWSV